MENLNDDKTYNLKWSADLGAGREVETECESGRLWSIIGPGIEWVDTWVKEVGGATDLRVRIQRTPSGINITIDRGEQGGGWWPQDGAPQISVAIGTDKRTAAAAVRVATASGSQEVLLGHVTL